MIEKIFFCDGRFFSSLIFGSDIPAHAIEISEVQHQMAMASQAGFGVKDDGNGNVIASAPGLDTMISRKRLDLADACQKAIVGGITHSALGSAHVYPTSLIDQQNLTALFTAAQNLGISGAPYKFMCADPVGVWSRREHTAEQIMTVGLAVLSHVKGCLDRKDMLVNDPRFLSSDIDVIKGISW